jgi:hypothetical protein
MIYFFCGAHKNASHFQRYIVEEALNLRGIEFAVAGNEVFHAHKWLDGYRLLRRLDRERNRIFLCKGHWGQAVERRILLSFESVRVFVIWRHILDVMVSSFHYQNNKFAAGYESFDDFYRAEGRQLFIRQVLYRRVWRLPSASPRVFQVNFEDLKSDFATYAGKMLAFAQIDGVSLDELAKQVSLERLRETRDDPKGIFFRKGQPGEHLSFPFSAETRADMESLQSRSTPMLLALDSVERMKGLYARLAKRLRPAKGAQATP